MFRLPAPSSAPSNAIQRPSLVSSRLEKQHGRPVPSVEGLVFLARARDKDIFWFCALRRISSYEVGGAIAVYECILDSEQKTRQGGRDESIFLKTKQ